MRKTMHEPGKNTAGACVQDFPIRPLSVANNFHKLIILVLLNYLWVYNTGMRSDYAINMVSI
jgi:hypothetical protein